MTNNDRPGDSGDMSGDGGYRPYGNEGRTEGQGDSRAPENDEGTGYMGHGYEGGHGTGPHGAANAGGPGFANPYGPGAAGVNANGPMHGPPGEGVRQPGGDEPPQVPVATYAAGLRIGDAFGFGFRAFGRAAGSWIGATVLAGIIIVLLAIVVGISVALTMDASDMIEASSTDPGAFDPTIYSGSFTLFDSPTLLMWTVVIVLIASIMQVLFYRGALEQVDGRKLSFGDFFRVDNWGAIVLGIIVYSALNWLIYLPSELLARFVSPLWGPAVGGIISFLLTPFLLYVITFLVDRQMSAIDAVKASFALGARFYPKLLLLSIISGIIVFIGAALCFVGLIAAAPISLLMMTHAYRQMTEGRRPIGEVVA